MVKIESLRKPGSQKLKLNKSMEKKSKYTAASLPEKEASRFPNMKPATDVKVFGKCPLSFILHMFLNN